MKYSPQIETPCLPPAIRPKAHNTKNECAVCGTPRSNLADMACDSRASRHGKATESNLSLLGLSLLGWGTVLGLIAADEGTTTSDCLLALFE